MQPNAVYGTVEGDLGGKVIAMKIDQNSLAHIMSILTDLYSDPALAVIREYSVNAWDSHVEAGISRPIEVTTPSTLSRFFKVKDFGVGLSINDLEEMYSMYGASTKRGTDEQTGMLGLGSKSGLTYTNQFTIVAVKGGVKATVSVRRVEDGTGVLEVVDTVATDEGNGVEIVIPVKNVTDFDGKAEEFFSYWETGRVLLNGKPTRSAYDNDNVTKIRDGLYVMPSNGYEYSQIHMGGVTYPLPDRPSGGYRFVAHVPIGSVHFTPSREELHLTPLTKNTISALQKEVDGAMVKMGNDLVANAATLRGALEQYLLFTNQYHIAFKPQWNGIDIAQAQVPFNSVAFYPTAHRYQTREYFNINRHNIEVLIINFPHSVLSADRKAKIRKWMSDNNIKYRYQSEAVHLCSNSAPDVAGWAKHVVDWRTIDKIDLGKISNRNKRTGAAPYPVLNTNGTTTEKTSLSGEIYYFSPKEIRHPGYLVNVFPNASVVMLTANRWDKFKRDYPRAEHVHNYAKNVIQKAVKNLTVQDIRTISMPEKINHLKRWLDPTVIDDPDLKSLLTLNDKSATLVDYDKALKIYSTIWGRGAFRSNFVPLDANFANKVMNRYPLVFDSYETAIRSKTNSAHIITYINAMYALNKEKK